MVFANSVTGHLETIPSAAESSKQIKLTTVFTCLSLLIGPVLFFICNAANGVFEGSGKFLAFTAFTVMGFELTWIIYGLAAWIGMGFYISDEYSDSVV